MSRHVRPLHVVFVMLLVFGLAPPWAPAPGALAQETASIESAVTDLVSAETGDDPAAITVSVTVEEDAWAYGTAAGPDGDVVFFLAHEEAGEWQVALRYTEAFDAMLADAPDTFPSPEIRASLEGFSVAGDGSSDLSFPYQIGAIRDFSDAYYSNQISFFTHRPNTSGSYRDPNAAFPVLAMRGGIAYRPCDGLVMIDHGDGWATYYAYVGSIAITNGQAVTRGQQLGVTSSAPGCAGTGFGDEVLVWLTRHGQLQTLNGIDIGGYTISTSEGGLNGSFTCLGRGDSGGDCTIYNYPNGIINDGEQGTTAYPDARISLDQNFPNMFQINGFPANSLATLIWQRPDGSQVPVGTIKTNGGGAAIGTYVTPETSASEWSNPNLLIARAGSLARSVKTNGSNSTIMVEGAGTDYSHNVNVVPGQQITVRGTGYTRNLVMTARLTDSMSVNHQLPGTLTTSSLGAFTYTFTVPAFAAEGAATLFFRTADATNQAYVGLTISFAPVVLLSSSNGQGGPITVKLRNFAPNTLVTLNGYTPYSDPPPDSSFGSVTTDANGSADLPITMYAGYDYTAVEARIGDTFIAAARYSYATTFSVSPASVVPGGTATLEVKGAPKNRAITAHWQNGSTWVLVATGTTNGAGTLAHQFTVPAAAAPGSTLMLRITVDGWYGFSYASVNISGTNPQPLVANAGQDRNATATTSSGAQIALSGSGSTPSASIVSYVWTRAGQQIATGATANVTVPVGVHDITLTVTDNQGRVASDTMVAKITLTNPPSATVNPTSAAPGATVNFSVANFPANSTLDVLPPSISGDSDPITSVQTNGSGAASGSFTVPNVPGGVLSFTFRTSTASATANLTVTARVGFAATSIKRNASVTITGAGFPANAAAQLAWLNGSTWTAITHPGGNSGSDGSVYLTFTVPISIPAGERQFRVTVGAVSAQTTATVVLSDPPIADAGWDETVTATSPQGASVSLYGGGSYDPDGSITGYVWREGSTQLATGESPTVTLAAGVHTITLTVTDNSGVTATDTVVITVNAFQNDPPVADAGPDQTMTLSSGQTSVHVWLDGWNSYDPDGAIERFVWTEGASQIATGESAQVSFTAGVHTVTLTVTDDSGATDTDTVVIRVNGAANTAPTANAGADQTVTAASGQQSAQVTLNGSGSADSDGTLSSYNWKNGATQLATGVNPTVTLAIGTHTITLTVTDDDGATASDSVVITVKAAAVPPIANAGPDQTRTATGGTAQVTLDGSGSSAPGSSITSYVWTEGSTQRATGVSPTVTLPTGTHTLTLTVTAATGLTASDTVTLTVTSPPSGTPTVTLSTPRTTVNSWLTYALSGYPASSPVTITWRRLTGSTFTVATVQTDAAGTATGRFRVPATPGGPNQQIIFSSGSVTRTVLFEVAPRIKVNTTPGVRGQAVDVSLRGYSRQEVVRIRWQQPDGGWVELARVTTSNTGSANVQVTVPLWAADGNNSVRGDGSVFRQQTNVVKIAGGAFQAASVATPTPTATPAATPLVVDGTARPVDAPWSPLAITDDTAADLLLTVTDGDVTTVWTAEPARASATLTVDLGQTITLTAMGWLPGAAPDGGCGTLTALEQSNDGVTWQPVDPARSPGAIGAPGVWQVQAASGEARFVRWTVTAAPEQPQLGCLAEVAVWGTAREPVEPTAAPTESPTADPEPAATDEPMPTELPAEPTATEPPVVTEPPVATETAVEEPVTSTEEIPAEATAPETGGEAPADGE